MGWLVLCCREVMLIDWYVTDLLGVEDETNEKWVCVLRQGRDQARSKKAHLTEEVSMRY